MSKTMRNYWLTIAMSLLGSILTVSTFLLWVVFPHGFFPARLVWLAIHKWVGLGLQILVLAHLLLHWHWVKRMTGRLLGRVQGSPDRQASSTPGDEP